MIKCQLISSKKYLGATPIGVASMLMICRTGENTNQCLRFFIFALQKMIRFQMEI